MVPSNNPDFEDKEPQFSIEEQLARYAKDMTELFSAHKRLEQTAGDTNRLLQMRAHEVGALNEFMRNRLAELFQLEAAYDSLLEQLERNLDRVEPQAIKQAVQKWVIDGRSLLSQIRSQRMR